AVLADGRVLAAGAANDDFALVRYTAAGAVDTTFGGKAKGKVVTDIGDRTYDLARAMVVQADGKIVLAGTETLRDATGTTDLALVRYNPDGSLDTSFDLDGKLTARFAASVDRSFYPKLALAIYPPTAPGGLAGK